MYIVSNLTQCFPTRSNPILKICFLFHPLDSALAETDKASVDTDNLKSYDINFSLFLLLNSIKSKNQNQQTNRLKLYNLA